MTPPPLPHITTPVPPTPLEQTLRNLPRVGRRIKDRPYRQVWRFEHDGKAYYLKFYPRTGARDSFRRLFRGSPAVAEFGRLQALQRAKVPAPRAVAVMVGFTLEHRRGDAVILEAIEPAVQLDQHLAAPLSSAEHRALVNQVISLVHQLQDAGLGHEDLHLGNFLLQDGRLFLLDGYAVRKSGMRRSDLSMLGHSVQGFATTTDLLRGWRALRGSEPFPRTNPLSNGLWDGFVQNVTRSNRYFGRFNHATGDGWRGVYYKRTKLPRSWSPASRLEVDAADWDREWPKLRSLLEADTLDVLKRSRSGDVLAGAVTLAGKSIDVIVKRPRRRYWYRYLNEIGRGSRPRRAWRKAWHLLTRGLPTAWPLLLMERRVGGYVVDAVLVCERVPGDTLAHVDLDRLGDCGRRTLLHRTGRVLRLVERYGFSHFDAKASNFIVHQDTSAGPAPVLIDVDGIRRRRWVALGIQRLLRSLQQENPTYTPADSLNLCRGYAPFSRLSVTAPTFDPAESTQP